MAKLEVPDPELPEGSMPTAVLLIVGYLNADGAPCYTVATKGESPMTTYLGLTVLAQQHLAQWENDE